MDIKSLDNLKYSYDDNTYNIYRPNMVFFGQEFDEYTVQQGEEMRIDLVMLSIYGDDYYILDESDVLLFINNIDNPLNINVGDVIKYPPKEALDTYRYEMSDEMDTGLSVRRSLAVPRKIKKSDDNRTKFKENGYLLPPVVLEEPKSPIRLNNGKIEIGGLN